jgi:hypothetical protein
MPVRQAIVVQIFQAFVINYKNPSQSSSFRVRDDGDVTPLDESGYGPADIRKESGLWRAYGA